MAIEITRDELTAVELRIGSTQTKDAGASRRMLAIALVLEGVDRRTAAETCGLDRRRFATGCIATTRRDLPA